MATQSFYEDMVIDTPEKAAAIEELFAHPEKYTYHCTGKINFEWADEEFLQKLKEKYCKPGDDLESKDAAEDGVAIRVDSHTGRRYRLRHGADLCVRSRIEESGDFGISSREGRFDGEERSVQDICQLHG